ncbi:MAG: hypothetical protein RR477_01955, partial [Raoultibacter sp.]
LVVGGWLLVVGCWWLVVGGWWLVVVTGRPDSSNQPAENEQIDMKRRPSRRARTYVRNRGKTVFEWQAAFRLKDFLKEIRCKRADCGEKKASPKCAYSRT